MTLMSKLLDFCIIFYVNNSFKLVVIRDKGNFEVNLSSVSYSISVENRAIPLR